MRIFEPRYTFLLTVHVHLSLAARSHSLFSFMRALQITIAFASIPAITYRVHWRFNIDNRRIISRTDLSQFPVDKFYRYFSRYYFRYYSTVLFTAENFYKDTWIVYNCVKSI